jgi:DNA repair exonuclease SbcCD nuclease subunit
MPARLEDFASVLDEIAHIAIEHDVDLVVDTGDSFDNPDPGPYSVGAYRKFAYFLERMQIAFLGITGNHNCHSESALFESGNWMRAVSDSVIRPVDPSTPIRIQSIRRPEKSISVVCADWMPRDKIPDFLSRIPHVVDAIFMHQSCDGFMPAVGRPEMTPSMVDGKARYAGIGDIHVTKKIEGELGTIIGSAGSTEMVRSNEPPEKFVIIVTFDDNKDVPVKWEPVRISTREVISFPTITSDLQVEAFRAKIMASLNAGGTKKPMVMCSYSRSMAPRIEKFQESLRDLGITMMRFSAEPDVVAAEIIVQDQVQRAVSMAGILAEIIPDPTAQGLALEMWNSPSMVDVIIQKFRQQTFAKYQNEGS